jgi:hypothetical protein
MSRAVIDIPERMRTKPIERRWLHALVQHLDDSECTYFLCPNKTCDLFMKPDCHVPCDHECPHKAEKAIVCHCGTIIILPFDHFSLCRVDCDCGGCNFQRMSGKYRRFNLPNKEDYRGMSAANGVDSSD